MRWDTLVTDWIFRHLAARVAAIVSLSNEAFALAREQRVGLDAVDHEVLLHQLNAANRYLLSLLCAFDREDTDDDTSLDAALELSMRYRPNVELPTGDPRAYLVALISEADRRTLVIRRWFKRMRAGERLIAGLGRAALHLDMALYLFGVERVGPTAGPIERVQHASTQEQLELVVEEYREFVRGRRDGDGGSSSEVNV